MSQPSCRRDRITDEDIVAHVRRFGPVTTAQIAQAMRFTRKGILSRLRKVAGIAGEKQIGTKGGPNIWRAV